ncbi:MAG: hypothetical protein HUJ70_10160 [Pseudobutyrivibrio sp.]|nr:hypothetical protein [Pseudobutyrivibrio sp.]
MSTSIDNLRRLKRYPLKDHQMIFDMYVVSGRDINYICIKMGIDPMDVINMLEGYGEKILTDSGLDESGKGRLGKLARMFVDEYVEHFYPGIEANPQNDWITIEGYLNNTNPTWRMA